MCAGLDVADSSFDPGDTYQIASLKGLGDQQENPCKKVLPNVLEREADGHAPDTEHFDPVARVEGRRNDGKCDEKSPQR